MSTTGEPLPEVASAPIGRKSKRLPGWLRAVLGLAAGLLVGFLVIQLLSLLKTSPQLPAPQVTLSPVTSVYSLEKQRTYDVTGSQALQALITSPFTRLGILVNSAPAGVTPAADGTFALNLKDCENIIEFAGPRSSYAVQRVWSLPQCFPWLSQLNFSQLQRSVHVLLSRDKATAHYELSIDTSQPGLQELASGLLWQKDSRPVDLSLYLKLFFYDWLLEHPSHKVCEPPFDYEVSFTGEELAKISEPEITTQGDVETISLDTETAGWRYDYCYISNILSASPAVSVTLDVADVTLLNFEPQPGILLDAGQLAAMGVSPDVRTRLVWQANQRQDPYIISKFRLSPVETSANPHARLIAWLKEAKYEPGGLLVRLLYLLGPVPAFLAAMIVLRPRRGQVNDWLAPRRELLLLGVYLWSIPWLFTLLFSYQEWASSLWFWAASLPAAGMIWWYIRRYRRRHDAAARQGFSPQAVRHQDAADARRWLWLLPLVCGITSPLLALAVHAVLHDQVLFAALAAALCLSALNLAVQLYDSQLYTRLHAWHWALAYLFFFILTFPVPFASFEFDPALGWNPQSWVNFFWLTGFYLMPYIGLAGLLGVLRQLPAATPHRSSLVLRIGSVLFAFYIVGLSRGVALHSKAGLSVLFLAFILAWPVYRFLLTKPRAILLREQRQLTLRRLKNLHPIEDMLAYRRAQQQAQEYFEKTSTPDEKYQEASGVLKGGKPWDMFITAPRPTDWENGLLGLRRGLWLALLLLAIYIPAILAQMVSNVETPFYLLYLLVVFSLPMLVRWLLTSFFFGYFYRYIRGTGGLEKGAWLALSIVACTLPHDIVNNPSASGLTAILVDSGQTILYLVVLGLWAFDYEYLRQKGYSWRMLLYVYGALPLASVGSALMASLISSISLVAENKFYPIIVQIVELISSPQSRLP